MNFLSESAESSFSCRGFLGAGGSELVEDATGVSDVSLAAGVCE